jgi:competence protein ComEC
VAAGPALLAALGYAALAGFSIPTQRAVIMLTVAMLVIVLRLRAAPVQGLALALVAVLVWDPGAVLQAGFWLSFGAVGVLLFAVGGSDRGWRRWWRPQWSIALGMVPLLIGLGLEVPLLGPLVNLLAIPWFGFIVVPLALLGGLLLALGYWVGEWLLWMAATAVEPALAMLAWIAAWQPQWSGGGGASIPALLLAVAGIALLLAPRGVPGRPAGAVLLLPLLLPPRESLPYGVFALTVLDVGQGLASVIETRNHLLLFDTGPRYRSGFETGSAVVLPYLRERRWSRIDLLMVSHADSDHSGGTAAILDRLPVGRLLAGESLTESAHAERCRAGQQWRWDGVLFRVLAPGRDGGRGGNDSSCVLLVEGVGGSVLLTGDIGRRAERQLLRREPEPRADVVVAPHHGSRSSSSQALVTAVAPEWVIYSAGYRNRWGFPHPEVVSRWRSAGARGLRTDLSGAIRFEFHPGARPVPERYRADYRRYWLNP